MLAHRRYLYLSSDMEMKETKGDKYKKTIGVPRFDEDFNCVSLISASIPNSFFTIQEEVNDTIIIHFEQTGNQFHHPYSITIKIPQGFCTDEDILKIINDRICSVKAKDLFDNPYFNEVFDKEEALIKTGSGFIFENEDSKMLRFELNSNAYFYYETIDDSHLISYITGVRVEALGLAFKYLGLPSADCYVFKDHHVPEPDPFVTKWPIKMSMSKSLILPARPSLIWVTSLQIRLDIINSSEDSQVLINIPIDDLQKEYITFQNNQVELTGKRLSNTLTQGQITVSITQQNGWELNLQELEYMFDVILFKSDK